MKVTVKGLAKAAGVSRGTVDRVLHNRGAVKPEVAERVRQLARELGYVPNRAGRALAAFKTPIRIGAMLASIGNPFFDEVKLGISQAEEEFADLGLEVVLKEVEGYVESRHLEAIDYLVDHGCKALCLHTINTPAIQAKINELADQGIVVVLLNTEVENVRRLCYVGSNYSLAGATCAGMLSMCRHADPLNILIVSGSHLNLGHNQRIQAFRHELERMQVNFKILGMLESNDSDIEAQKVTADFLKAHPEVNCVYVTGSGVWGVGSALIAHGDRSIIGIAFDEYYSNRQLLKEDILKFVVCQQPARQGYHAVKRAYQACAGQLSLEETDDFITDAIIKVEASLGS